MNRGRDHKDMCGGMSIALWIQHLRGIRANELPSETDLRRWAPVSHRVTTGLPIVTMSIGSGMAKPGERGQAPTGPCQLVNRWLGPWRWGLVAIWPRTQRPSRARCEGFTIQRSRASWPC